MGRGCAHQLESERRPIMLGIPDQDRQEQNKRDQRREPWIRAEQPAPTPVRYQHECEHGRNQHHDGKFRQQRQPGEHAGGEPPAPIAAFVEPDQCPHHRDGKRNQRHVGRDLGHQQPVVKGCFRHQHREHDRADVMRHAPDDIGEQQLRDQHRKDAGEPDTQIGIAEDRGTETDEPGNHRRMIEEGKHVLLRPGPVIGLIGAQIDQACVNHPQCRQRGDQRGNGEPLPKNGTVRFGAAAGGLGNRHGAFSPTPIAVSTC